MPVRSDIAELGSMVLIYHSVEIMNKVRFLFRFNAFEMRPIRSFLAPQAAVTVTVMTQMGLSLMTEQGKSDPAVLWILDHVYH